MPNENVQTLKLQLFSQEIIICQYLLAPFFIQTALAIIMGPCFLNCAFRSQFSSIIWKNNCGNSTAPSFDFSAGDHVVGRGEWVRAAADLLAAEHGRPRQRGEGVQEVARHLQVVTCLSRYNIRYNLHVIILYPPSAGTSCCGRGSWWGAATARPRPGARSASARAQPPGSGRRRMRGRVLPL